MTISQETANFKITYQLSPIILQGGIAGSLPDAKKPIYYITENSNFENGILAQGTNIDLDEFFANFQPLPGASIIDQQVATYPFANSAVAANAVIANPLTVSMLMHCPARANNNYSVRSAKMLYLQSQLAQHNAQGGTYIVMTPSYIYTNCLMVGMRDVSSGESKQPQTTWQLDFMQPLLTLEQATLVQNSFMQRITNQVKVTSVQQSGAGQALGSSQSVASPSIYPVASGPGGSSIAPPATATPSVTQ